MNVDLWLGGCLDVLPTLEAGSIDAIITDLPYGTTACSWDEVIPFAPMWEQVKRVLKPRGAFVTTASQPFTSKLVMSNPSFFRYSVIWFKSKATNFLNVSHQPLRRHEDICVFYAGKPTYNPVMSESTPYDKGIRKAQRTDCYDDFLPSHVKSKGARHPSDVIYFKTAESEAGYAMLHPTQKPVALYAYLIRTYTNPGDTVLDFCMGSGTTGVAAVKEGRNFVGVEQDEHYFAIAQKRIAEAQMQLPLPLLEAAP